jgi:5'(3')-deoxyribonucleotidase
MKRILIDMDEVIAEVYPKFLDIYEQEFGRRPEQAEFWGKKIYDMPGAERIREYLHHPGFFADLPVIQDSQDVIRELMDNYEVFINSAAMEFRHSLQEKYDWLQMHFPFIPFKNVIFCGDKRALRGDYMIDDHTKNLRSFQGTPLLFTASHNAFETEFIRVNSWQEVRTFFRERDGD